MLWLQLVVMVLAAPWAYPAALVGYQGLFKFLKGSVGRCCPGSGELVRFFPDRSGGLGDVEGADGEVVE